MGGAGSGQAGWRHGRGVMATQPPRSTQSTRCAHACAFLSRPCLTPCLTPRPTRRPPVPPPTIPPQRGPPPPRPPPAAAPAATGGPGPGPRPGGARGGRGPSSPSAGQRLAARGPQQRQGLTGSRAGSWTRGGVRASRRYSRSQLVSPPCLPFQSFPCAHHFQPRLCIMQAVPSPCITGYEQRTDCIMPLRASQALWYPRWPQHVAPSSLLVLVSPVK